MVFTDVLIIVVGDVRWIHAVLTERAVLTALFIFNIQVLDVLVTVTSVALIEQQGVLYSLIVQLRELRICRNVILVGNHNRGFCRQGTVGILCVKVQEHLVRGAVCAGVTDAVVCGKRFFDDQAVLIRADKGNHYVVAIDRHVIVGNGIAANIHNRRCGKFGMLTGQLDRAGVQRNRRIIELLQRRMLVGAGNVHALIENVCCAGRGIVYALEHFGKRIGFCINDIEVGELADPLIIDDSGDLEGTQRVICPPIRAGAYRRSR